MPTRNALMQELVSQFEVYTEAGGNDIGGDTVENAEIVEENTIGVAFTSGERFFITVEEV